LAFEILKEGESPDVPIHYQGQLKKLLDDLDTPGKTAKNSYATPRDAEKAMASIRQTIWKLGRNAQYRLFRPKDNQTTVFIMRSDDT
jgi:hypothetical protein